MNDRLKILWSRFLKYLSSRSQAEKAALLVISVLVIGMAYLSYVYDPLRGDISTFKNQVASANTQIINQQTSFAAKLAESQQDPEKFARDRLAAIARQRQVKEAEIANLAGKLITPNQMTAILSSVLGRQSGMALINFSNDEAKPLRLNLATAGVDAVAATLAEGEAGQIFEHGLTIVFEGDFFNTLRYLSFLEDISGSFFWDSVSFQQTEWPNAIVTLKIHTLSTEEGFIGV
jgi:MSHA biogenesis protein MshJ